MKVVVIGLGSMGKRRIRLIKRYDDTIEIYGVDISRERRIQAGKEYGITTMKSMEDIKAGDFSCAFISTSPLSHSNLIHECLRKDMNVFSEINLIVDGYDANMKLANEKGKILFLSSTFLYREEMQYIDHKVKQSKCPVSYIYHVGQYLPDWHPWEDYLNFFVSDKRTNGCRELFAIELPWLLKTFGDVKKVDSIKSKNTNLSVDYPDSYHVIFEHENGVHGSFAVDVVSRKAVRNLEIFSEDLYIAWNGTPEGLYYYDYEQKKEMPVALYKTVERKEGYDNFIIENSYLHEIEAFFAQINEGTLPVYDFQKDKRTLALIDEIER